MAHAYLDESLVTLAAGSSHTVTGPEADHAVKVARLQAGERIDLLNGRGVRVPCEVTETTKRSFTVCALADHSEIPELDLRLHLVQALAKGGRDEQAVQMATELGVSGVVPWQAHRSVVKWQGDKAAKQQQRWQTISREATKQSLRAWLPSVSAVHSTTQLCRLAANNHVLVLDPTADIPLADVMLPASGDVYLCVGPEGGVTADELQQLQDAGATRVRLGSSIMRTSTAGAAAIAVIHTRQASWELPR